MAGDFSYKVAFVFAIVLHFVLVFFLFIKSTSVKPKHGLIASSNFINAVAINERDFNKQLKKKSVSKKKVVSKAVKKKKIVKAAKKKPVAKKPVKKKVVTAKKVEARKKILAEKKKKEEILKKEKLKKEMMEKKELEVKKALYDDLQAERNQLSKELHEAERRVIQGEVDKYKALITQAIDSRWNKPDSIKESDYCQSLINVAPGGVVLSVDIVVSSGNEALERSAKAAVLKSSPLPVPEDAKLFNEVRTIRVTFGPKGVG